MDSKKENIQDLVWARMKYCPYWPARIVSTPSSIGKTPRNKMCVLFFGTKQFGFVDSDKVENYSVNRSKFIAKGKGEQFTNAVKKMDEYISDQMKYKSNAVVKPNNILVKTEHQVESILGIKRENDSHNKRMAMNIPTSTYQSNANKWVQEKKSLIDKITALKSENQKLLFDLKKTQKDSETVANENRTLKKKLNENDRIHLDQIGHLQDELSKTNAAQKIMKDDHLKRIAELSRERDLFRAQFKQLQNEFAQQSVAEDDNDDEQYEIECLLADESIQIRRFFVSWKGYDSSHNSWVYEKDLNCSRLLKKYDQLKKNQKKK